MRETHTYIGPTTKWGLQRGAKVVIVGRRSGGTQVRRLGDSVLFLVGSGQLERIGK